MILKQKTFQKLVQIMKLKETKKKKCHIAVSNPHNKKIGLHGAEQSNA